MYMRLVWQLWSKLFVRRQQRCKQSVVQNLRTLSITTLGNENFIDLIPKRAHLGPTEVCLLERVSLSQGWPLRGFHCICKVITFTLGSYYECHMGALQQQARTNNKLALKLFLGHDFEACVMTSSTRAEEYGPGPCFSSSLLEKNTITYSKNMTLSGGKWKFFIGREG